MKIAVIGSRNPGNIDVAGEIQKRINIQNVNAIISGGAVGIDTLAAEYANKRNIPLVEYRPDYTRYGRGATFVRNRQIVDSADVVFAFWDGASRGTKYTIDYAKRIERRIIIIKL